MSGLSPEKLELFSMYPSQITNAEFVPPTSDDQPPVFRQGDIMVG